MTNVTASTERFLPLAKALVSIRDTAPVNEDI